MLYVFRFFFQKNTQENHKEIANKAPALQNMASESFVSLLLLEEKLPCV